MKNPAARTALMPIALAAIEQYFPEEQRIIDDHLATKLLPVGAALFVWLLRARPIRDWVIRLTERSDPGIWAGLLCRKRFIDDKLRSSARDIGAVVNLGAGFDTRAYRMPAVRDLAVWEVDQRENVDTKRKRLRKAGIISPNVKLIAMDFERDDPGSALAAHGYAANKPTFFVLEGVTQYLADEGVKAMFAWLAEAAPGSRLVFTYIREDFLTGKNRYGWETGYKRFVVDQIWRFGINPEECPAFLGGYGWRIIEDADYGQLARAYISQTGRGLTWTPVERVVYAQKD
jgi:methyltransferase (TIGR00027 family)